MFLFCCWPTDLYCWRQLDIQSSKRRLLFAFAVADDLHLSADGDDRNDGDDDDGDVNGHDDC